MWKNNLKNGKSEWVYSKPLPAALTLRICKDEPTLVSPVPPKAVPTDSPDWNSAIPVATFEALKTTRTGVLSAIV